MTPKGKPSARKHNIVIQHVDNETLVYDLTKNKAYCLNETAALVWRECNGTLDADKISQKISKTLKAPVSEDIVWLALSQFKKDGLLEDAKEFTTPFDGMSRRDVVKYVGFASAVALPVISSLIAPSPVHAQSGPSFTICTGFGTNMGTAASGCPCNMSNADCVSGCVCGSSPTSGFTCCAVDGMNTCVPGNTSNLSAPGCVCAMNNAECQTVCGASVSMAGVFTCGAL